MGGYFCSGVYKTHRGVAKMKIQFRNEDGNLQTVYIKKVKVEGFTWCNARGTSWVLIDENV